MLIDFSFKQNLEAGVHIGDSQSYQIISDDEPTLFTSNNNLSLRLRTEDRINPYCPKMTGGEDMFICLKLLKKNYKYLIDQNLSMQHKARPSIPKLLKQFFNYGYYSNDAIAQLGMNFLEVFYCFNLTSDQYKLAFKLPFPIKGIVYLNYFVLHLALLVFSLITLSSDLLQAAALCICFDLYKERALFLNGDIKYSFLVYGVKYLVNLVFLLGGMYGLFLSRVIFVPPCLHRSNHKLNYKYRLIFLTKTKTRFRQRIVSILNNISELPPDISFLSKNKFRVTTVDITFLVYRFSFFLEFYLVLDFVPLKDLNK